VGFGEEEEFTGILGTSGFVESRTSVI